MHTEAVFKLKAQLKHTLITIMVTYKFWVSPSVILLVTIKCLQKWSIIPYTYSLNYLINFSTASMFIA